MQDVLGRPVKEALSTLGKGEAPPLILETAASGRMGAAREEGTLRVVACREGVWIAARFLDGAPRENEEA